MIYSSIVGVNKNNCNLIIYTVEPTGNIKPLQSFTIQLNMVAQACTQYKAVPVNFAINDKGMVDFKFGAASRFTKGAYTALVRIEDKKTSAIEGYLLMDSMGRTRWMKSKDIVMLQKQDTNKPVVQNLITDTIRNKVSVYPDENLPTVLDMHSVKKKKLVQGKANAQGSAKAEKQSIYSPDQLIELNACKKTGGTVKIISNPELSPEQMRILRIGETKFGALTSLYADPAFSPECMKVLNAIFKTSDDIKTFYPLVSKPYPETKDATKLYAMAVYLSQNQDKPNAIEDVKGLATKEAIYDAIEMSGTELSSKTGAILLGASEFPNERMSSNPDIPQIGNYTENAKYKHTYRIPESMKGKEYHAATITVGELFNGKETPNVATMAVTPQEVIEGSAITNVNFDENEILALIDASASLLEVSAEDEYEEYLDNKLVNYLVYFNTYDNPKYTTAAWQHLWSYRRLREAINSDRIQQSVMFQGAASKGRNYFSEYLDGTRKIDINRAIATPQQSAVLDIVDQYVVSLTPDEKKWMAESIRSPKDGAIPQGIITKSADLLNKVLPTYTDDQTTILLTQLSNRCPGFGTVIASEELSAACPSMKIYMAKLQDNAMLEHTFSLITQEKERELNTNS